jgi:hypothetical protein
MAMTKDILIDGFGRVRSGVNEVVKGLETDVLTWRADPDANTIAWLVWHLTRVQDDHVAELAGVHDLWSSAGWAERFGLDLADNQLGYGHTSQEVGKVRAPAELLWSYHEDVHAMTTTWLRTFDETGLDEIIDRNWDPPVTVAVRIVSVLEDTLQHVGQAGYVRGLAERAR